MTALTFAAFANTFKVPFQFDDLPNIVNSPSIHVNEFSLPWLGELIRENSDSIRVFSYLTFALNFYFGGLQVFGYHLINLLIHLGSGFLLYWFLLLTLNLPSLKERYGSRAFPVALFSSLLFLCHPIQTQSVTYIVQRMASMAGMFYLLAMALYVKGRLSSGMKRALIWTGAAGAYLLGLLTKENVAILPLFVGLYEFYFFQNVDLSTRGQKRFFYGAGAILLVGLLAFLAWGRHYVNIIIEGFQARDFTLAERVLTQFRVVLYYLTLLVWPLPSRLNLDYDFPTSHGILDPPATLLAILIVAGLIGYSLWTARKRPLLSYFILWYFGNLLIESSIFPLEMVYEHRLYLPMVGPVVLFVVGVVKGWENIKERFRSRARLRKDELPTRTTDTIDQSSEFGARSSDKKTAYLSNPTRARITDTLPLWIFFIALALVLSIGAFQRNKVWSTPITLWEDCVRKSPKKERPHYNLGQSYYEARRYQEAIASYQTSIRLQPGDADAYNSLGLAYKAIGAPEKAADAFREALRIKPAFSLALSNLGFLHAEMNQYPEAVESLKKVIQLRPGDAQAFNNLGVAYRKMGKLKEAVGAFRDALRLKPESPDVYNNLGLTYTETNQYAEAIESFKKALQIRPFDVELLNNLGVTYRKMGRIEEAIEAYQGVLAIKPESPDACNNLGLSLYSLRRYQEAVKAFEDAIRLKPGEGEFHYNLGVTYTTLGNLSAAAQSYQETIRLNPGHVRARFNLAVASLMLKKRDLALEQYQALKSLDGERAQRLLSLINNQK
jgi:protein O-mannosyl-transferase